MIVFTTIDDNGEPVAVYEVPDQEHLDETVKGDIPFVIGRPPTNAYYANGAWIEKPVQPSGAHVWDTVRKCWLADTKRQWLQVREKRSALLKSTDWLVTKAIETGEPMPQGWATYRQALRDVTGQADPGCIDWPQEPGSSDKPAPNA